MEIEARPYRRPMPTWRKIALNGLGDGPCQVPQPGVAQVYPACTGNYTGVPQVPQAATYQAPNLAPVPACISGPEPYSAECQQQLMDTQHANQSALDAANRAVFVADCNSNWAANDAQYARLGLPRPANDCQQRLYGQTLPGTTGGAQQAQIPTTYISTPPPAQTAPVVAFTNLTSWR